MEANQGRGNGRKKTVSEMPKTESGEFAPLNKCLVIAVVLQDVKEILNK